MPFQIHPQLNDDCIDIGRLPLSRLLLMNDSQYPWCILVPEKEAISEIYQLSDVDQRQLQRESSLLSAAMAQIYHADKMNIAAIGNIVPQLHIHHVVRYHSDISWPHPVWGRTTAVPYSNAEIDKNVALIRRSLDAVLID